MADATAILTDISAITKALAVPEVLSYILITAGKRYLSKFRLVSHAFLQACAPYFFIRIPEHHFSNRSALSSDQLRIIRRAGCLLRSLSLINDDSASFDAFATSLRLQRLRLACDNPSPTALPISRVFAPLFKERATLGTKLQELNISVRGDTFNGTLCEWNTLVSPRCLLDPESGLDSPLGLILSRLSSLEIFNEYEQSPRPMRWSTMVDILQNVCPKLTKLTVHRIPLEVELNAAASPFSTLPFTATPPPQDFPPLDVFPAIATLFLNTTSLTIQELIQFNRIFPSVERVSIQIKSNDRPLPPIDPSVALSFKTVILTRVESSSIVPLLPILPRMTSLSMEQHTGELNLHSMVQAFKSLGERNQFKLLSFPFSWTVANLRDFIQLDCLRSLESLELWNSGQAFLEAIGTKEPFESKAGSEHRTLPSAPSTATATVASPAQQTPALPVFLDTIRVLRLKTYISRMSSNLTTTQTLILSELLKKMPRLEHLSFQRDLLPDLSVFEGLERNQPPLRYLRIAVAASTGRLTPDMVSTQILDRYEEGLEDVNISLEGPQDIMKQSWVKKLIRWFNDKNNRRHDGDLRKVSLSQCHWC
ncbi:MAG: hypothetical protein JOS17DRAFT_738091 [Linnemannia elongata]|nr:MAG: hypothetical protein JOS17DRAFT_738091 [Linnemannia elongata]